jgi:hypothetical protein
MQVVDVSGRRRHDRRRRRRRDHVKIAINEIAEGRLSGSLKGGQVSSAEQ